MNKRCKAFNDLKAFMEYSNDMNAYENIDEHNSGKTQKVPGA